MTPSRRGAAVLGSPIAHSLSPVLHQAAYDELGLAEWTYRAVECTEADLGLRLAELEAAGLAGVSLTMPLKRAVMATLNDADRWAKLVGAANTVLFTATDGRQGANTDVPGMVAALRPLLDGRRTTTAASVLGAGATAASAIAAISELGVESVTVFARRPQAAATLSALAQTLSLECVVRPWDDVGNAAAADLVITTTPPEAGADLAPAVGRSPGVLFDVIYSPWPTPLAAAWEAAGGVVVGGLELLVEQAALQVELMTGRSAPVIAMRDAGYAALHVER
jgi:shikimate dehydrogenase